MAPDLGAPRGMVEAGPVHASGSRRRLPRRGGAHGDRAADVWACPRGEGEGRSCRPVSAAAAHGQHRYLQLRADPNPRSQAPRRRAGRARLIDRLPETVRDRDGGTPLLAPCRASRSRSSPRWKPSRARHRGGAGVLLTGVDDVPGGAPWWSSGAGNVGRGQSPPASARVTVFSRGDGAPPLTLRPRSREGTRDRPIRSPRATTLAFADAVAGADLVIGGVLEPGSLSPKLLSHDLVARCDPDRPSSTSGSTRAASPPPRHDQDLGADVRRARRRHYAVPNMPPGRSSRARRRWR